MPRVAVPVTVIGRKATVPATPPAPVVGDATNNHTILNDGHCWFEAKNTGVTSRTVTVVPTAQIDGQAVTGTVFTLAAGDTVRRGGWPTAIYGNDLQVNVSHLDVTLTAWSLGS